MVAHNKETLAKETVSLGGEGSEVVQPTASSSAVAREEPLRDEVMREPENGPANHQLGKILIAEGKADEAIPYLERAARISLGDYDTAYDLARAYAGAAKLDNARASLRILLIKPPKSVSDQANLYHLLGDVEEKSGNPLEAVREYQRAAKLDPSEVHLFDWGAELLMHRAAEPAIEVFSQATAKFPRSSRMLVGLGVALYVQRGSYDQAAAPAYARPQT